MRLPEQSVVVAANQRTGSTLLCRALADTGLVGTPEEYFLAVDERILPDFHCWEEADHVPRGLTRSEYLAWVYEVGTTPNGVFAVKMMWDQLEWVAAKFRTIDEFDGLAFDEIVTTAMPNLQLVLVTRRDRLAQAISWARASQDWVWVVSDDEPPRPRMRPTYDRQLITRLLELIPRAERGWRDLCDRLGVTAIEVAYEDLVDDLGACAARVVDELGLGEVDPATIRPRTTRQADEINAVWTDRYLAGR